MPHLPKVLRRLVAAALLIAGSKSAHSAPSEYEIKAVFLFHFTQFVGWPEAAFPEPDSNFVIGLVGSDPFGPALESIVGGESVGRHHLAVQKVTDVSSEFRCQILYFSADGEDLLDLRRLRTAPVLTVGESDSFYKKGGMIQFFIDRRRVRLKVNLEEARAHSLEISAKLLRVADVTDWDPIRNGVYTMVEDAALEPEGRLPKDGPLGFLVARSGYPEFGMGLVQQVLAHN
jgi:uncharacterized protein DUF4154